MKKRIFYFNIVYGCNSNCIFCYSHNTWHNGAPHNELSTEDFSKCLSKNQAGANDRVIINGGEPLIHSEFMELLDMASQFHCEILVYTNGRLLKNYDFSKIKSPVRIVVPIHGDEKLHDEITGVRGSYRETIEGLDSFRADKKDLMDLKIILNNGMIVSEERFSEVLRSLDNVYFNNAIHLTKMADTRISIANGCKSLDHHAVSYYLRQVYRYYKTKAKVIRIFDACVENFREFDEMAYLPSQLQPVVYFKDYSKERLLTLARPELSCMNTCRMNKYCKSAVGEYTTLEICGDIIREGLE